MDIPKTVKLNQSQVVYEETLPDGASVEIEVMRHCACGWRWHRENPDECSDKDGVHKAAIWIDGCKVDGDLPTNFARAVRFTNEMDYSERVGQAVERLLAILQEFKDVYYKKAS